MSAQQRSRLIFGTLGFTVVLLGRLALAQNRASNNAASYSNNNNDNDNNIPGKGLNVSTKELLVDRSFLSGDCGKPTIVPLFSMVEGKRIVGGIEAKPNSWPWQCRLQADVGNDNALECGASVISRRFLITAAHCLFYKDMKSSRFTRLLPAAFSAFCGCHVKYVKEPTEQMLLVTRTIVHERYDPSNVDHDIALVELAGDLTFNDVVSPVCLPSVAVHEQTDCMVTGWGLTERGGTNKLMQVNAPIHAQDRCPPANGRPLTKNMLCAGDWNGGKDACNGDSGGPLVCRLNELWVLHGIVSFGYSNDCGAPKLPGVYTRVEAFRGWIKRNAIIAERSTNNSSTNRKRSQQERRRASTLIVCLSVVLGCGAFFL